MRSRSVNMALRSLLLRFIWTIFMLTWLLLRNVSSDTLNHGEEVDFLYSDKLDRLGWISEPQREWDEVRMRAGTSSPVPVLQACGKRQTRTLLSPWMERGDVLHLLMDVTMTQEEEPDAQPRPLHVHLFDLDSPISKFRNSSKVLSLWSSKPFPVSVPPQEIFGYLNQTQVLHLGSLRQRGFQVAFSFSGSCVLLTSIRLYYRMCPSLLSDLVLFRRTGAGSGLTPGSCVQGAVEGSPPLRDCGMNGTWGSLLGGCNCGPGKEETENVCKACSIGYYKPANGSEGCLACPRNTLTLTEGSEECECRPGFIRRPSDHHHLGCTKPPSPPMNLATRYHDDSVLMMTWDAPQDRGDGEQMMYSVTCEKEGNVSGQWEECGSSVKFLQNPESLTNTSISMTGLDRRCHYRLTVRAWNEMSTQQEPSPPSTIIIHAWTFSFTETSDLNTTNPATLHPGPLSGFNTAVVSVLSAFLLLALVSAAAGFGCKRLSKIRSDRETELQPLSLGISFSRLQTMDNVPTQSNENDFSLLAGIGGNLLKNLKDVLVERSQLTLGKELGKGEFGSVYKGVFVPDEGPDISVAVKTMRVGINSLEDLKDFLKEAEIMKNFDHENVVKLLGVTLESNQDSPLPVPLVILPYMQHGDLRSFLIASRYGDVPVPVSQQTLLQFMVDIAAGMSYLSSRSFLHRDLAARNCMLGEGLRVCVADFGLSKKIYTSNYYRQTSVVRMPIKWMAIESLSESVYSTRSDVWSFGVTMWEIVSRGMTPYPGVNNHELLELLQSGHRLKAPVECNQKTYEVMQSCWEREPGSRPSFRDLYETLTSLSGEMPAWSISQEASYMNCGLNVSSAADSSETPTSRGGRQENIYLTAGSASPS